MGGAFQSRAFARSICRHDVCDVIVLADGDEPGEAAAQHCARRCNAKGEKRWIARAPSGMDFNDLLKARNPALTEGEQ